MAYKQPAEALSNFYHLCMEIACLLVAQQSSIGEAVQLPLLLGLLSSSEWSQT